MGFILYLWNEEEEEKVKVAFNNDESFAFLETRAFSPSPGRRKRRMQAAKLSGPTWEPVQIPYERTTLPGYFYKVDNSGRPLFAFWGLRPRPLSPSKR